MKQKGNRTSVNTNKTKANQKANRKIKSASHALKQLCGLCCRTNMTPRKVQKHRLKPILDSFFCLVQCMVPVDMEDMRHSIIAERTIRIDNMARLDKLIL